MRLTSQREVGRCEGEVRGLLQSLPGQDSKQNWSVFVGVLLCPAVPAPLVEPGETHEPNSTRQAKIVLLGDSGVARCGKLNHKDVES